ncbi:MAG: hypothetical protein D6681_13730 [Calditrichaeota bacterium]|nr:MAG: hypothetical protein D6681_13730 [Calditrichota bacterium]
MRMVLLSLLCLLCSSSLIPGQTLQRPTGLFKGFVDDNDNFTSVGNIGLTVTNYGVFGDGFVEQAPTDQPSCEYPRGSGIEHIFDGGLWVGAQTSGGVRVSTGAFNSARIGSAGSLNFEYTNTADPTDIITVRSSLPDDKFFSPEAISHQDFVAEFSDTNVVVPGTGIPIPQHTPLGIAVHLETYAWNFPFADAFVIFNYTITNVGWGGQKDTLRNVYVGLWADLVVRNTNLLPPRVGAPFYQDVGVGVIDNPDTAQMIYAYEMEGGSNYTAANSYVGLAFLGADPQADDQLYQREITYNWWFFSGGSDAWQIAPSTEAARYSRMTQSIDRQIYENQIFRQRGNYMNLICTGPFERLDPDSSINVVFAIVCAKKFSNLPPSADNSITRKNLIENVSWALRAYHGEDTNRNGVLDFLGTDSTEDVIPNGKLDRYILPTPPSAPIVKAIPENGRVTLLWDNSAEESVDLISKQRDFEGYRVYRSFLGSDLTEDGILADMELIAEFDRRDGLFYDVGLESVRLPEPIVEVTTNPFTGLPDTVEYHYQMVIDGLHNGWQYAFTVTAFDSGDVRLNLPSLESSQLQNVVIVSPGTPPLRPGEQRKIGVYPNPYRVNALWDGGFERQRKLHFYNLPARCEVRIYTLAGDLVDSFIHEGDTYRGQDIQWYQQFSEGTTIFPGGEHAWDLVTEADQAIATGLYLFTVKDLDTGEIYRGKFVVIK